MGEADDIMVSDENSTMGFSWNLSKGNSELVDSWPLMGSPLPILSLVLSYLAFVLYIGPALMKDRRPFKLNGPIIVYNITQVLMSLYIVQMAAPHLWEHGMVFVECLVTKKGIEGKLLVGTWWYFMIKLSELADTVFFVLRKKYNQVSFLHVYHHTILVVATWIYLKYTPTEHVIFLGFINSFVHVIMYAYYALTALGPSVAPYLFWKKYITTLQLIQFLLILYQTIGNYYNSQCPPHVFWVYFFVGNLFLFIYLFSDFYRKTYSQKRTSKTK